MIKNIVFDLGNVIIDLDIDRTFQQLDFYLGEGYDAKLRDAYSTQTDLFFDYEMGKISEEFFFTSLRAASDHPLSIRQLKEAWNAMLLKIPPQRFELLTRLKSKYNVLLLSNTNKTHLEWVHSYLKVVYNISDFEEQFFHKAYYSHLIGLRKPNADCYQFVLDDAQIRAEETLFIDDNSDNIEGAKGLGIHTILHTIGAEVADVLAAY
jgi:glucose-1-phosphatase